MHMRVALSGLHKLPSVSGLPTSHTKSWYLDRGPTMSHAKVIRIEKVTHEASSLLKLFDSQVTLSLSVKYCRVLQVLMEIMVLRGLLDHK